MRYGLSGWMAVRIALSMFSSTVVAGKPSGSASGITFSNTALVLASGSSEPAVTIGPGGTAVFTSLSWITFGTNVWKTSFGGPPGYQGIPDNGIASGQLGGEDADVDIGSTGTLHFTSLVALVNPRFTAARLGVSAITCLNADTSNNFANCKAQIIDTTQADRQWITSDGPHVYISYHDSGSSSLIHVQRSDDDGFTFHKVSDPITGHAGTTGNSTFNNDQGKLVADPFSHNVYTVWTSGVSGLQKGSSANFNNVYVTVSKDLGLTWTPHLVFSGTVNVALNNVFPSLAVDPLSGTLYAGWSDAHQVFISKSTDQGQTWTSPVAVNTSPANTALFPWIAARVSTLDYVYYGTNASSKDDPTAVW